MLEEEHVDIVISDMQMPEVNGTEFLERVRQCWPDTLRLLLTGHADHEATIGAINRGEVWRYITKPWNEDAILLIVRDALERQALQREKSRLEALTRQQNEQLRELNATLEQRVRERTAALVAAQKSLQGSHERLKSNFLTLIKVLSGLVETRSGAVPGHGRRVADLARRIALRMGLSQREAQDVFVGGLLHEIGKTGLPDNLIAMPESLLKGENLGLYRKYPLLGEQLLMPLEELREAAHIVRAHRERFDGAGFPDGAAGSISRSAHASWPWPAISRHCSGACSCNGKSMPRRRRTCRGRQRQALRPECHRGVLRHPLAAAFTDDIADVALDVAGLKPGMVLSRDLLSAEGTLLLSADHVLNDRMIKQLADFERRRRCNYNST